jgi:hypothetical protein
MRSVRSVASALCSGVINPALRQIATLVMGTAQLRCPTTPRVEYIKPREARHGTQHRFPIGSLHS